MSLEESINDMQLWLLQEAKDLGKVLSVMKSYVPRLKSYGIQIDRMLIGTFLIHTQLGAWSFKYESPNSYSEHQIARDFLMKLRRTVGDDAPFRQLELGAARVRIKTTDDSIPDDVRYLFTEKGYTDMYSLPVHHRRIFSLGITWATRHADGFSEDHIRFLDATHPALGAILQFLVNELVTYSLLCTYLGNDPGTRVHKGSVYRGDGVTLRSVIWFSDIREFTALSQKLDRDSIISLINDVFEVTEAVLTKNGGEILKFMGDGLLAVFIEDESKRRHSVFDVDPDALTAAAKIEAELREAELHAAEEEDNQTVASFHESSSSLDCGGSLCEKARKAAAEFQEGLQQLREKRAKRGLAGPRVGVGLHYGDCSYGNVGAPTRLDFTVIGPSVNLASRVEGLCPKLGSCVLATENFVEHDPEPTCWDCRGEHTLKGVADPVTVFELLRSGVDANCLL